MQIHDANEMRLLAGNSIKKSRKKSREDSQFNRQLYARFFRSRYVCFATTGKNFASGVAIIFPFRVHPISEERIELLRMIELRTPFWFFPCFHSR
jgi:hypothetical protein